MTGDRGGGCNLRRNQVCSTPGPWRPSKLRFEVDALRSPGVSFVGVHRQTHRTTRLRHWAPRLREDLIEVLQPQLPARTQPTLVRPASSRHRRPCALLGALGSRAEIRSAIGARTQEHGVDRDVPAAFQPLNPMLSRARPCDRRRCQSCGPAPTPTAKARPGFVPQVTNGLSEERHRRSLLRQTSHQHQLPTFAMPATASSHAWPDGARSRPLRNQNVVSSG